MQNQHWLVLGLGDTGLSLVRWLRHCGATLRVADTRSNPPHGARMQRDFPDVEMRSGPYVEAMFANIDAIAISPGVALAEPLVAAAVSKGIPVVGDIELFAQALEQLSIKQRPKVIGITGSNGKSTVTTMVGELCKAAGLNTVVAGNIGLPVLDALFDAQSKGTMPEVFVLELSSFQLESTATLKLNAATVLNLSEDHLDRYKSMADYAAAKARIFEHCDCQILNRDDPRSAGMRKIGARVQYFGLTAPLGKDHWGVETLGGEPWLMEDRAPLLPVADLPMAGLHNAANALAALALVRAIDLPLAPLLHAIKRFRGLPHRVEKVMDIGSVAFYDDSKGTNVGATVAALRGMKERVVLIAGGDGKGQDFKPLSEAVAKHARAVVLIGRDADLIAAAINNSGVAILRAKTMQEAVKAALGASAPGDCVLLSPACASFDMFNNYSHRAQAFIDAVRALAGEQRSLSQGAA